jgi:molybdate/tungstate transport system substrate-binding protein
MTMMLREPRFRHSPRAAMAVHAMMLAPALLPRFALAAVLAGTFAAALALVMPDATPASAMPAFAMPLSTAARSSAPPDTVVIFEAGSLVSPIGSVAAGFTARTGIAVRTESGGSLAQARKLTVDHRIPDILALADAEVIPRLVIPRYASWYARFARNRVVIAYSDRARGAPKMSDSTWWKVLTSTGVRAVRSDPNLDPGGYRAVIAARLAERFYDRPGLARSLLEHSVLYSSFPGRANPDSLLRSGSVDYAWIYESYALDKGLHFQRLPAQVDLSDPADSAIYATISLRVAGATNRDTITVRGTPIIYGLTIPRGAPHRAAAEHFVNYLFSPEGRAALRHGHMEPLAPPVLVGDAPSGIHLARH